MYSDPGLDRGQVVVAAETTAVPPIAPGRLAQRLAALLGHWQGAFCTACLLVFLALGAHQLDLPGLQYDETKEAGLNAMQLVTGQPVTAFRDAIVHIGSWQIPLMVQDYIGSLNVVLATPFLAVGGITPAALRWLPLLTGALTLWLTWRVALRVGGKMAAAVTAVLLAVNPSFIFWSRQGIFVTNITALCFMAALLFGLRWWQTRRPHDLWLFALFCGLGVYAKLLFAWVIGAMVLIAAIAWVAARPGRHIGPGPQAAPPPARFPATTWLVAGAFFLLPLLPLIAFNVETNGTLTAIFGNLGHSYYGVDNRAYWPNLLTRLAQLQTLLRGDHLWYLGEVYTNAWAPWLAGGLALAAIIAGALGRVQRRPAVLLPIGLIVLIVAQSAFTVSDLFITHYAPLLPLIPLAGGLAAGTLCTGAPHKSLRPRGRLLNLVLSALALIAVAGWAGYDAFDTLAYHRVLALSGGYGSHSDGIYRLAAYLEREAPSAPIALDWGLDAQLRFLSRGRVNPVEVFGYDALDAPDPGFANRAGPFLADPHSVFVAHVPEETVFRGRVALLAALAVSRGLELREEARFGLRSGKPLYVVYRG